MTHYTIGKIAGSAAIIDDKKRILLLKRSAQESIAPHKWTFPSGAIEPFDASIEACVIREVKEETNLDFVVTDTFKFYDGVRNNKRYFTLVHLGTYSGTLQLDPTEAQAGDFFTYSQTQDLDMAFSYSKVLKDLYNAGLVE